MFHILTSVDDHLKLKLLYSNSASILNSIINADRYCVVL